MLNKLPNNQPDKTKLLVIGVPEITRSLPSFPTVKLLLDKEIKPVPMAKDLGVKIDSSLSYNEHVTKTFSPIVIETVSRCLICCNG